MTVRIAVRAPVREKLVEAVCIPELGPDTDWSAAVAGQDAVLHLAARAHVLQEDVRDPGRQYMLQNCHGTLSLARQAFDAGVRRFVFVSSAGVGGSTGIGRPISELDPPRPSTHYARSKLAAETGLQTLTARANAEHVIVRPALVHGPGVPGNLHRLMTVIARGLPLPFGLVRNRRSLVGVQNLADLLYACLISERAAGRVYYAVDDGSISTPDIIRALADGIGRPARLVPVPRWVLSGGAAALGRRMMYAQLCESLEYDGTRARTELSFRPRLSLTAGLYLTGRTFLARV
jgi:nucleoside-diphosphate-sugar epimerase